VSYMRWGQPPTRRYGVKRLKSALDVAAEQVLGYRTGSGGENHSTVCPINTQLLIGALLLETHSGFIAVPVLLAPALQSGTKRL
jgi:hypothetical protein